MDKITNDARVYTDVQGLDKLRAQYKSNPEGVKKEAAQQFEALFIQMVLRSMRQASEAISSGLFSSNDMTMYQDMFDKQLSSSFSEQGLGFAKLIEESIDHQLGIPDQPKPTLKTVDSIATPQMQTPTKAATPMIQNDKQPAKQTITPTQPEHHGVFSSQKDFIDKLSGIAKKAAKLIGVHPAVLLAQAALETDWGKKVIAQAKGISSYNLFNIKADSSWHKEKAVTATLEQKNGVVVKQHASFKSYDSYHESFMDYANLITKNQRYRKAVENAAEPKAYAQALQEAGYATDGNYANKIIDLLKSKPFNDMMKQEKII